LRQRPTWLGAAFIVAVALPVFAIINVELTWFLQKLPAFEFDNPSSWLGTDPWQKAFTSRQG